MLLCPPSKTPGRPLRIQHRTECILGIPTASARAAATAKARSSARRRERAGFGGDPGGGQGTAAGLTVQMILRGPVPRPPGREDVTVGICVMAGAVDSVAGGLLQVATVSCLSCTRRVGVVHYMPRETECIVSARIQVHVAGRTLLNVQRMELVVPSFLI